MNAIPGTFALHGLFTDNWLTPALYTFRLSSLATSGIQTFALHRANTNNLLTLAHYTKLRLRNRG